MVYDEIVIRRTGPGLPTLSLVDLPGIRAMEDGDLMRKTQELVDYYINEEEACRQYPRREAEAASATRQGKRRARQMRGRGASGSSQSPSSFPASTL